MHSQDHICLDCYVGTGSHLVTALVKLMEEIGFGEVTIKIQNGLPISAEKAVKNIRLDKKELLGKFNSYVDGK